MAEGPEPRPLAITLGDPAGVGAEVVFRALASMPSPPPVRIFGSWQLARATPHARTDGFVDIGGTGSPRYGSILPEYGRVALDSIDAAVAAIERGECSGLVTAPIHKQACAAAGSPFPGHTELLASRAGLERYGYDFAMYFESPRLRTVLLSVHVPLREAIALARAERIAALALLTDRECSRIHESRPRISVAGVNPHAGEGGMFGDEEKEIERGVAMARDRGIDISGPHAPDTVFRQDGSVVMSMYHDQGLIALKTLDFDQSVNVTLGLPYLRCSVDHGTAFDIAGKWVADDRPMQYALRWAATHAGAFAR
jgi:4-hydroxythreonine-4-phosphate dehydrogenase